MKKTYLAIFAVFIIVFAIIIFNTNNQGFLKKHGIENLNTKQLVDYLEKNDLSGINASINGTSLTIVENHTHHTYTLDDDLFYLSIAPYMVNTHTCAIHNLVTCRAELSKETFNITIISSDGEVLIDDVFTSHKNGFIGIWLPKNIKATITIQKGEKTATSHIETLSTSNTCLTTMRLR